MYSLPDFFLIYNYFEKGCPKKARMTKDIMGSGSRESGSKKTCTHFLFLQSPALKNTELQLNQR